MDAPILVFVFEFLPVFWILILIVALKPGFKRNFRLRLLLVLPISLMLLSLIHALAVYSSKREMLYYSISNRESSKSFSLIDSLIPEESVVRAGAEFVSQVKNVDGLGDYMKVFYRKVENITGRFYPSPFLSTYLGLQSNDNFSLIEVPSATPGTPRPAIFFHGGGGNFVMECMLVATILRGNGYTTFCPSFRQTGWWPSIDGRKVFLKTIDFVKQQFPGKKILIAGLSNGGHALSVHSALVEKDLAGMIFLSGGTDAAIAADVPGLLIWGTNDTFIPFDYAQRISQQNKKKYVLKEFISDHFVLMRNYNTISVTITDWIKKTQ